MQRFGEFRGYLLICCACLLQSIRKTYEQIVKRLKEERVGFDNQLAAIERTLKAKEKDLEELVLMSHDAQHAKEV